MSSEYFDASLLYITAYSLAKSTDINSVTNSVDVGFQKLPEPRSDAIQAGKKGFVESFTIADVTEEDNPFSYKQWQSLDLNSATDTGSANAYAMNISPSCTAYRNGIQVKLFPANTNTSGTCTLSLCGLAAIPIKRNDGKVLAAGDISEDGLYELIYYNGYFIISGVFIDNLIINDNTISAGDNITITQTGSDPYDFEIAGDVQVLTPPSTVPLDGSISGMDTYSDSSNNKIYCKAGALMDSTNTQIGVLSSLLSKLVTSDWAAGDGAGARLNGSIAADKLVHIWALIKDSDETIDIGVLLATEDVSSYLPTGYSKYRYLDSYNTTAGGSGNDIAPFITVDGLHTNLKASESIWYSGTPGTSYTSLSTVNRLPSDAYVRGVLYGGNAGGGTASTNHVSLDGTNFCFRFIAYETDNADTEYNCWGSTTNPRYMLPAASSIYIKQEVAQSVYFSVQQFQIRR